MTTKVKHILFLVAALITYFLCAIFLNDITGFAIALAGGWQIGSWFVNFANKKWPMNKID